MAERLFCWWCDHVIIVEETMTPDGERQTYSDGNTGRIVQDCPGCGEMLDVDWLYSKRNPIRRPYCESLEEGGIA